ncbi:hypothetical protein LTR66_013119 [Elasticomyces elasticus]|nr:hypothetical protein LTR66_013119 [Elasticomyces elasticus]
MTENIERVLERGERIDLLVDKTDRLGGSARDFRVRSRGLRRRMWWKNVRLMVLLVFVIVFLIYLFVGFGCGLPGESSFRRISKCPDGTDPVAQGGRNVFVETAGVDCWLWSAECGVKRRFLRLWALGLDDGYCSNVLCRWL